MRSTLLTTPHQLNSTKFPSSDLKNLRDSVCGHALHNRHGARALQDLRELGPHALARDLLQERGRGFQRERELGVRGALTQLPVYEPASGAGVRVQGKSSNPEPDF
jgi:hypothetical protein